MSATYRDRVCTYRAGNGRFPDTLFKEVVKTCSQHISYCGAGSNHQNAIVDYSIKELTLVIRTLLLHVAILLP